jgi:hypothetical protein
MPLDCVDGIPKHLGHIVGIRATGEHVDRQSGTGFHGHGLCPFQRLRQPKFLNRAEGCVLEALKLLILDNRNLLLQAAQKEYLLRAPAQRQTIHRLPGQCMGLGVGFHGTGINK